MKREYNPKIQISMQAPRGNYISSITNLKDLFNRNSWLEPDRERIIESVIAGETYEITSYLWIRRVQK